MVNILATILLAFIFLVCALVAFSNLLYRFRGRKKVMQRMEELEAFKDQGTITEEQFESAKDKVQPKQEPHIESCMISAEEMVEAVDAALKSVGDMERDESYTGNTKWAKVFGILAPLDLSLKEAILFSMKLGKPREANELLTEILAMNIPIDALEVVQSKGKSPLIRYDMIADIVWIKARDLLSEPISTLKEIHKQRKFSDESLLSELVPVIMKSFQMPTTASGFAALLALMIAKVEFNAFSGEEAEKETAV